VQKTFLAVSACPALSWVRMCVRSPAATADRLTPLKAHRSRQMMLLSLRDPLRLAGFGSALVRIIEGVLVLQNVSLEGFP
jgi:hypothetical protein